MGKRRRLIGHLNLLQRLMLWFAAVIVAVLACTFISLNLLVVRDMRSLVELELGRTRTLFEDLHRMRGDDLRNQCLLLTRQPRLRVAVARRSPAETAAVLREYAETSLGATGVMVVGPDRRPLATWWHPGAKRPRRPFAQSIAWAMAGEQPPAMDVSPDGIYQTAWATIREGNRRLGTLILGVPIDDRLAQRLGSMSGANITFFSASSSAMGALPRVVASTLHKDARDALVMALANLGFDPRRVRSEGPAPIYKLELGEEGPCLAMPAPIRGFDREVIGAYIIQRSLSEEEALVARVRRTILWVGLAALLAAVGTSYVISKGVAWRLLRIVRAAEVLSTGDWSRRVPVEGPEDIRILAEAFNRMAARLQSWDAELRAEVALRTEELNQALARLDSNLRQMRQFHADASHELRTPLTIMRGEVEVALRTPRTPEEYQRVLNSILEEMNRVSSIVEHLLLLARADSGQIQVERAPVEVNGILEDLHPQVLLLAAPKRISVELSEDRRVMVLGDSGKLRQLFLNLIDNAIKYTPEGGHVSLSVSADDGFAVVSVADTGIGIAQEDIPHIFDRFYRVDRARSREMGGTGLGLAICQWIIDAHHGWIDVQSKLGEGSVFTVHIPRVFTEEHSAPPRDVTASDDTPDAATASAEGSSTPLTPAGPPIAHPGRPDASAASLDASPPHGGAQPLDAPHH